MAFAGAGMSLRHKRLSKKMWALTRFLAFQRDGFRCVRCGLAGKLEGHHKVALNQGGLAYDPANVETLCRNHHLELSIFPPRREWARHIASFKEINQ